MTDKYEKVEGMTIGQVVDAIISGEDFFFIKHDGFNPLSLNIQDIDYVIKNSQLHRKIKTPWWEKHLGSPVMVSHNNGQNWFIKFLKGYIHGDDFFVATDESYWKYMRPLTAAEKDAIITEG